MKGASRKGVVVAVLSGRSFLFKESNSNSTSYSVIYLPFVVTPNFSMYDDTIEYQPFGFESWESLRKLLLDQNIIIYYAPITIPKVDSKFCADFAISEEYAIVCMENSNLDIDGYVLNNGLGGLSPIIDLIENKDVYHQWAFEAKEKGINIYGGTHKVLLKAPFEDFLIENGPEFCAIVMGIDKDSFLIRLMTETGSIFVLELSGVTFPGHTGYPMDKKKQFTQFFFDFLLSRTVRVQIHGKTPVSYLGSIISNGFDIGETMIRENLSFCNTITLAYLDRYEDLKNISISNTLCNSYSQGIKEFINNVTILSIPSTNKLLISLNECEYECTFSHIRCPHFSFDSSSEYYGFDTWLFIRDSLLRKTVSIEIDGYFPILSVTVYHQGSAFNGLLLSNGMAELSITDKGLFSESIDPLYKAYEESKAKKLGIHSEKDDSTFYYNYLSMKDSIALAHGDNRIYKGIVVDIICSYVILLYSVDLGAFIYVALQYIIPRHKEDISSQNSMEIIRNDILHSTVEVNISSFSEDSRIFNGVIYNNKVDLRIMLVAKGVGELKNESLDLPDIKNIFPKRISNAKKDHLGIYDKEHHPHIQFIPKDSIESIIVTRVMSPGIFCVQYHHKYGKLLKNKLKELKPNILHNHRKVRFAILMRNRQNFRVRIINVKDDSALVHLLDLGFSCMCQTYELYCYPSEFFKIEPCGFEISLAFLTTFNDRNFNEIMSRVLWNAFSKGEELFIRRLFDKGTPQCVLYLSKDESALSLNEILLKDGLLKMDAEEHQKNYSKYLKQFQKAEEEAIHTHVGGWTL